MPRRGDCRRCHDVTSRAPRWREELGLSVLLAARCHLHAPGTDEPRLPRRGAGMARLAYSGSRRQSEPGPDHVRGRWRAMVAGADRPLAPRIRELGAGANWQRRVQAIAARRLWRDRRRDVSGAESRYCAIGTRPSRAAGCIELSGNGVAGTGRRHLGGGRRPAALRLFEGHGLGRLAANELETQAFHESGQRWREIADEIHAEVCERGFDRDLNSFVQAYGSKLLDASLLLIPIVGFLPPEDPRVRGTLRAIEERLLIDGEFVLRYETEHTGDGLPAGEGAFLACSFWLVDNNILQGRDADARKLFGRLLARCNDVGLLAEEFDPLTGRMLGNFPQAYSHVGLINCALSLSRQTGPIEERAEPDEGSIDFAADKAAAAELTRSP